MLKTRAKPDTGYQRTTFPFGDAPRSAGVHKRILASFVLEVMIALPTPAAGESIRWAP